MDNTLRARPAAEVQARAMIGKIHDALETHCARAVAFREKAGKVNEYTRDLDLGHVEFANVHAGSAAVYTISLLALVFVWGVDVLLVGAYASYLAAEWVGDSDLLVVIARYGVPAILIGVETWISVMRQSARKAVIFRQDERGVTAWTAAGLAWAILTTPLIVIASDWVGGELGLLTIAKAAMGFIMHCSILMGGRMAAEAHGYFAYKWRRRCLTRQRDHAQNGFDREKEDAIRCFGTLCRAIDGFIHDFGQAIAVVPSSRAVRTIINEAFEDEIVPPAKRSVSNSTALLDWADCHTVGSSPRPNPIFSEARRCGNR